MIKFRQAVLALLIIGVASSGFAAEQYKVSLTRKDRNLYKVDGTHFWVQTKYCYVFGYGEEAVLNAYEVVFLEDRDKCDVKTILKDVTASSGTYKVSLTHEDDNLYSTFDGTFVRTSLCLNLALGEDSVLRLNGYGGGTVIFLEDGDKCDVEAVLTKVRL